MNHQLSQKSAASRLFGLGVFAVSVGLAFALPGYGQMTPEEHASHHPGQAGGAPPTGAMPPGVAGPAPATTPAAEAAPADGTGPAPAMKPGSKGGMDMGKMMQNMGKAPPKDLYPTLMSLPDLTPELREEVQSKAQERMRSGVALLSKGLDRLGKAAENDDYLVMQEATGEVREGLAQFESGLAARRALAEGKPPPQVALQWFKNEMNLQPPQGVETRTGLFGVTTFHLFTMVLLIAFSLAMIAMYFFKMRRAAALFGRIETDSGSPPPGSSPPLAGTPGPSAPSAPSAAVPPAGGVPPPAIPANKSAAAAPTALPAADAKSPSASGRRKVSSAPRTA